MNTALAGSEVAATASATVATTERRERRTSTGSRTFIPSLPSDYSDIAARSSLNRDLAGPVQCGRPQPAATREVDCVWEGKHGGGAAYSCRARPLDPAVQRTKACSGKNMRAPKRLRQESL